MISDQVIDSDEYPRVFKEGDWVHFSDGVTCQILKLYTVPRPRKSDGLINNRPIIKTMFGTNMVPEKMPMIVLYDRERYGEIGRSMINKRKLTYNNTHLIAQFIEADFDFKKTYVLHYKEHPESWDAQKYHFIVKLKDMLATDEGRKLFAEIFCRRFKMDLSFEDWRRKIEASIPETLTKQFHLDMWLLLGKLSPEVRKKLMEAEGAKEPGEEGGGFLPPQTEGSIKDAEYQDVCKVCSGTKVFKTTARVDGREVEIEVPCPACKDGDTQLPQVQKRTIGLRV